MAKICECEVVFLEQEMDEVNPVFFVPLSYRRYMKGKMIDTEKKIATETALLYLFSYIPICCGNKTEVASS